MGAGYDVIGDIHGRADQLKSLLHALGYRSGFHPDDRKIIFMGDYINRGPQQEEALDVVREMLACGLAEHALMGNHELSLIRYLHQNQHGYVRPHTAPNEHYHAGFFKVYPRDSQKLEEAVLWMKGLKLYLRNNSFDAVHAYISDELIAKSAPYLAPDKSFKAEAYDLLDETHYPDQFDIFDAITTGPRFYLPANMSFQSDTGSIQKLSHLFWWKGSVRPEELINKGRDLCPLLGAADHQNILALKTQFARAASAKPLFIGHYSLTDPVGLLGPSIACVDYRQNVTAYRWNEGDQRFFPERLICV